MQSFDLFIYEILTLSIVHEFPYCFQLSEYDVLCKHKNMILILNINNVLSRMYLIFLHYLFLLQIYHDLYIWIGNFAEDVLYSSKVFRDEEEGKQLRSFYDIRFLLTNKKFNKKI